MSGGPQVGKIMKKNQVKGREDTLPVMMSQKPEGKDGYRVRRKGRVNKKKK